MAEPVGYRELKRTCGKAQLYEMARQLGIPGRAKIDKGALAWAVFKANYVAANPEFGKEESGE